MDYITQMEQSANGLDVGCGREESVWLQVFDLSEWENGNTLFSQNFLSSHLSFEKGWESDYLAFLASMVEEAKEQKVGLDAK